MPPTSTTTPARRETAIESQPLKYLAGRSFKPQATQNLNIRSRCTHRDALGTRTRLDLQVKNAQVGRFSAEIAIPKHGICRFDLQNFVQKATQPQALLSAKDGSACTVRLWEQESAKGRQVTIAFNSCQGACTGDTFDYLWPILVDARTGRCF